MKTLSCYVAVVAVFILVFFIDTSFEQGHGSGLDHIRLTPEETEALAKFRKMMLPYLNSHYMKENIYLIKWLRAKDLNLDEARQMLLDNLKWRKANNIDTITSEDWSDMKEEYVYRNDGYDKKGRPVGTVNLGQWNVLKAAISGRMPRLTRYMTNLLEQSSQKVIQKQYRGENVTTFKIIMNLDGFNGVEHTCPVCLPLYTNFVDTFQNYYTGYPHKIILINTPAVFKTVLDIIQPLFTPGTKKVLKIFGYDRTQWMAYLDKDIPREQRRPEFGGTKRG